jgi:uncharacterized protein
VGSRNFGAVDSGCLASLLACTSPELAFDNTPIYTQNREMNYSFDPHKQRVNLQKHGLDLADAPLVIESAQTVTFEDRRFAYDEERFVTLGLLQGVLVVVVTAERDDDVRVISMRKADRHEQKIYRENLI